MELQYAFVEHATTQYQSKTSSNTNGSAYRDAESSLSTVLASLWICMDSRPAMEIEAWPVRLAA